MQLPDHGANPHNLYTRLGIAVPARVLDFSENVNPVGVPQSIVELWPELFGKLSSYPDPSGEPFRSAASAFHSIATDSVFVGNGAAELLALLAERYRGKRAIIVHPTFSEYEATLLAKNADVVRVIASEADEFRLPLDEIQQAMKTADVLYLCTPNNPTGVLPERDVLQKIIHHGKEVDCEVVMDEAFIDFVDESLSFIPETAINPHLIIVRSMTKMYAIPGIRLGYVVANPTLINEIQSSAPHWNVNGIAATIGASCLQEEGYRERAIAHSRSEREKMKAFLKGFACTVTDSKANFLTFKPRTGQAADKLYMDLLVRGIVLRHSKNFQGMDGRWLRIGMKHVSEMNVLKEELTRWFEAN